MTTTTSTNRWLRIGLTLAWLMILGGLIGVLSARIGERPTSLYMVVGVAGTLLNAGLLNVSWRRARALNSAADGHGIGRSE